MQHKILVLLSLICFSSCMKLKKKGDNAHPQNETIQSQEVSPSDFKGVNYKYIIDGKRNYQQIIFNLPKDWPEDIIVKKTDCVDGAKSQEIVVRLEENKIWNDFLTSEKKINYKFFAPGHESEALEEIEVLPALDLDLSEDLNLAQKYQLNSKTKFIYFKNLNLHANAHLYFENYSGLLKIESLISDRGALQTFTEGAKATPGVKGRSGGLLRIEILHGQGEFNMNMFGEAGGDGMPGAAPDAALKGRTGEGGTSGQFGLTSQDYTHGSEYYECIRPAGGGYAGGKGLRGYTGANGEAGGNSGTASIYLFDSKLSILAISRAGVKGFGGAGGRGGAGGSGGPSGNTNPHASVPTSIAFGGCSAGPQGDTGPEGDPGVDGHEGADGLASKNSLFINGVKTPFANEN